MRTKRSMNSVLAACCAAALAAGCRSCEPARRPLPAAPVVDRPAVLAVLPGANCAACGYPGCQGYAQALACLEGRLTREQAIEDTAKKTRHYAKRQWTWFRREPGARFLWPPSLPLPATSASFGRGPG